jgi:predicted Zn-dependent protease
MHQTSDFRPHALEDFVRQAASLTRQLEPDPKRALPEPEAMARPGDYDLGIYDPEFEGKQAEHWIDLASQVEAELASCGKQAKAKYVSSQGAAYGETAWELFADSRGFVGELEETAGYIGGSLVLLDRNDESKRRMGYWAELGRELSGLGGKQQIQSLAGHAQERTEWQMGAKPGPTGVFPIVVENRVAGKAGQPVARRHQRPGRAPKALLSGRQPGKTGCRRDIKPG